MSSVVRLLKDLYLDARFRAYYGTSRPRTVQIFPGGPTISVDATDHRARKKILASVMRGRVPRNRLFWKEFVPAFDPDCVLDIGLNYGECLFSMTYPESTRLFGFEANLALRPFLETSRAAHPNANAIQTVFQLVTDGECGEADFFVDKNWSGGSSAALNVRDADPDRYSMVKVATGSIDATLKKYECQPRKLFFKIDVEGYEPKVLAGMRNVLASCEQAFGFVEFDGPLLEKAGTNLHEYWKELQARFELLAFDREEQLHRVGNQGLDSFLQVAGRKAHTDLVLLRNIPEAFTKQLLSRFPICRTAASA